MLCETCYCTLRNEMKSVISDLLSSKYIKTSVRSEMKSVFCEMKAVLCVMKSVLCEI